MAAINIGALLKALVSLEHTAEVCLAITTVSLALRLWTRGVIQGRVQSDDWSIILAWVSYSGCNMRVSN